MSKFPKSKANRKPPAVPVHIPDHVVADPEFIEAMKRRGAVLVSKPYVRVLESIGMHLNGAGVTYISRGRAMVNPTFLDSATGRLSEAIQVLATDKKTKHKLRRMVNLASALGYLSGKLTASQRLMWGDNFTGDKEKVEATCSS